MLMMNPRARIPLALTLLRAALAPAILAAAGYDPNRALFGLCLALAFLSDVFDGVIARRLDVVTPGLRLLDSLTDTAFYACAVLAAFKLYPARLESHSKSIVALIALELTRYAFDWLKFRRVASYHMWSSKLWGLLLFIAFFALLVFGRGDWTLSAAIYCGILADVEGLAISWVLSESRTDVASIVHALRRSPRAPGNVQSAGLF
jgi:CDP-diacylglycerol--glycerol-3-phosphate 3-phosphatidyltransferase